MKPHLSCVLLGERHAGLAEGIAGLLGTLFEVVVIVSDATSLIEAAARLRPEMVVVDLGLACLDVHGFLDRLRVECPELRVVFLIAQDENVVVQSVSEAGADGFVVKGRIASDLVPAVETVLQRERFPTTGDPGASVPE